MMKEREKIEIIKSQKGQQIAKELIQAVRNAKEETLDEAAYASLKDCIENNRYAKQFIADLSDNQNYKTVNKDTKRKNVQNLIADINYRENRKCTRRRIIQYGVTCASAFAILSFLLYFNSSSNVGTIKEPKLQSKITITTPTLISYSGEQIELKSISDTTNTNTYIAETTFNTSNKKSDYNTVIVPSKYTYIVILSDGSEVLLNANSKLKYPIDFGTHNREVTLEGEAYFKVKKSDKPFIVTAENSVIKVYGTQFNVNSYNKDKIKTTLISGSVGVSVKNNHTIAETIIQPNQMLLMNRNGTYSIDEADISPITAWVNGEIICHNELVTDLLDKISNWYGVEFSYSNAINDIRISTSFYNSLELEKVLESIMTITELKIIKQNEEKYMIR